MKLVILAATVFLSYAAFSLPTEAQYDDYLKNYRAMNGDVQGNGGDGIECDGKLETLDVYEARVMMPWMKPDFGIGSLNIEGKLRTIADRLAAAEPVRAIGWAKESTTALTRATFVEEELTDVPDHGYILLLPGCKIRQIVIQMRSTGGEVSYTVNRPLWDRLDTDNKVAMLLHEAIYGEALSLGHTNSQMARYFNIALFSNKVAEWDTDKKYIERLEYMLWPLFTKRGIPLLPLTSDPERRFHENGGLVWSNFAPSIFKTDTARIQVAQNHFDVIDNPSSYVRFDAMGNLIYVSGIVAKGSVQVNGRALGFDENAAYLGYLTYYANGLVKMIRPMATSVFAIAGKEVWLEEYLTFHVSGGIKCGRLARDLDGNLRGQIVEVNEDGESYFLNNRCM